MTQRKGGWHVSGTANVPHREAAAVRAEYVEMLHERIRALEAQIAELQAENEELREHAPRRLGP